MVEPPQLQYFTEQYPAQGPKTETGTRTMYQSYGGGSPSTTPPEGSWYSYDESYSYDVWYCYDRYGKYHSTTSNPGTTMTAIYDVKITWPIAGYSIMSADYGKSNYQIYQPYKESIGGGIFLWKNDNVGFVYYSYFAQNQSGTNLDGMGVFQQDQYRITELYNYAGIYLGYLYYDKYNYSLTGTLTVNQRYKLSIKGINPDKIATATSGYMYVGTP